MTATLPILKTEEVLEALRGLRARQPVKFYAFYSSQLGGIVTDPALMVLPFDDHMVHRGHGIFDTAAIVGGKVYDLDAHLDRFIASAERSKLRLPGTRQDMRDIIMGTAAASGKPDGGIRYWLSSGPGSLDLTPAAGAEPGFFVMIFAGLSYPDRWYTEGLKVMTTTYPIKPALYAITKSTNYLPNVLMQMEAKEVGLDNGVFIDKDGFIGESSNMNVAFVTQDGVFRHPKFDQILSGCTSKRLLELAPRLGRTRADQGRRGLQHPGRRCARRARDDAVWQLHQGGADRRVGQEADPRRQAGPGREGVARIARGRHADGEPGQVGRSLGTP